ncbi:hypothetical protein GGI23_003479, partial [Coemansia sp. RSA 2559]
MHSLFIQIAFLLILSLANVAAIEIECFGHSTDVNAVVVAVGIIVSKVLLGGSHHPRSENVVFKLPPTPTVEVEQEPLNDLASIIAPLAVIVVLVTVVLVAGFRQLIKSGAAESGAAEPDTAEPNTAEPGAAEPDTAEPDTAEPDAAEPGAAETDTAEPDAAKPGAAETDTAEPDTAEPVPATLAAAKPAAAKPDTAEPAAATSVIATLEAAEPASAEPASAEPAAAEPAAAEPAAANDYFSESWTLVGRGGKAVRASKPMARAATKQRRCAGRAFATAPAPTSASVGDATASAIASATAGAADIVAVTAETAQAAAGKTAKAAAAPSTATTCAVSSTASSAVSSAATALDSDSKSRSLVDCGRSAPPRSDDAPNDSMNEAVYGRCMGSLLNRLSSDNFESVSDKLLEWANKSARETDGWIVCGLVRRICAKATDEPQLAHLYARLCDKVIRKITSDVVDDTLLQGKPTRLEGILVHGLLLETCQNIFQGACDAANPADLESAEQREAARAKRHGISLVRFIGELYLCGLAELAIIHDCIRQLLVSYEAPGNEKAEALFWLLAT